MSVRDLDGADKLVSRYLKRIAYFGCNWAFENPESGLPNRGIMKGIPYQDTTYCNYGYAYRKATRIWSSMVLSLREPCSLKIPCSNLLGRRHPKTAQQSRRSCGKTDTNNTCSQRELYSIPHELCDEIALAGSNPP